MALLWLDWPTGSSAAWKTQTPLSGEGGEQRCDSLLPSKSHLRWRPATEEEAVGGRVSGLDYDVLTKVSYSGSAGERFMTHRTSKESFPKETTGVPTLDHPGFSIYQRKSSGKGIMPCNAA